MKCKMFVGTWFEVQDAFNNWAKGKALSRDVLIHEQVMHSHDTQGNTIMAIIVYHPEDPYWDKTERWPKEIREAVEAEPKEAEEIKVTQ